MNDQKSQVDERKRLALFFDGTWNTPENNTNVWRLKLMLAERAVDSVEQRAFYDQGVGTHTFDRITGGAFGFGLAENVEAGYRWLMENYNPGDEIYVFGFSRGAFTARSLVGLIARCGLLKPEAPMSFAQILARYKKGSDVRPIYEIIYRAGHGETITDFEEKVLLDHSWYHRHLVKMVGVWDTVGALGIHFGNIPGISARTLRFHDTNLSVVAEHSYQALALDEERKPFWAMLWTQFVPDTRDEADPGLDDRYIEQRWFSGSHCNVGGGYQNDLVSQRPLAWIQQKAEHCGLSFRSLIEINDEDYKEELKDSYEEFLGGLWQWLPFPICRRYVRWVMSDRVRKARGTVSTVNERIDISVFLRCQKYSSYRPPNLREWALRKRKDLDEIISNPNNHPDLWTPITTPGVQ